MRREPLWFPIFLNYYSQYFKPEEIHVINHSCADDDGGEFDSYVNKFSNRCVIENIVNTETFDHEWLRQVVMAKQRKLLRHYSTVVFAEIDEILYHQSGLDNFIDLMKVNCVRATGFEVVQKLDEEGQIDWGQPLLGQRSQGYFSRIYSKTLISKIPLSWSWGFHNCKEEPEPDPELYLIHLHKIDFDSCLKRNRLHKHTKLVTRGQAGEQNVRQEESWLRHWWNMDVDGFPAEILANHVPIPKKIKASV